MEYQDTQEAVTYLAKKQEADLAHTQWVNSQSPMDWEYYMMLEVDCGSYAAEHEEKIFNTGT